MGIQLRDRWIPPPVNKNIISFDVNDESLIYITLPDHGIPYAYIKTISYSITREMAPIYVMGSVIANSFSRGRPGITGTLEFSDILEGAKIPKRFDIYFRKLILKGVELIHEGHDVDMSNLSTYNTYTFVADKIRNNT